MAGFLGFVDDACNLGIEDKRAYGLHLERLKGKPVIVIVKVKPRRQGSQSMRYYRGVVIPDLAEACGESDPDEYQEVHEAMAWKFLKLPDGKYGQPRRQSTSKDTMSQEELTDYISKVITWGESSVPGCRIRRPDEVDIDAVYDPGWE